MGRPRLPHSPRHAPSRSPYPPPSLRPHPPHRLRHPRSPKLEIMASVKKNIILNGINTVTGILFPVITFPYAARILLPDGIGAVNFLNSIISYIVLLTSLGIPLYAVKEVAKYHDDKINRDKVTVEIIILSTILCLFGYIAVWLLAKYVPQIHRQSSLFYILSLTIVFTSIGVNWFYQGIEDFKFITIRAIIIRALAAAALFLFVKDASDLLIYGMITVGSTVGNNFINFIHLRKHISLRIVKIKDLKVLRHFKGASQVFILNVIISLYVQLNLIMLGFISGDEAVGYYTAGTKIVHICVSIISSIAAVLLPRCTYLLQMNDDVGFSAIIKKSMDLTTAFSLPMAIGLMLLANPIVMIFCGKEYIDTIPILYLTAPIILFIALTNVLGVQILYPKGKINIVIFSVLVAAITNILFNIMIIPTYGAIGAAISTCIAEFMVLIMELILGRGLYPFKLLGMLNFRYIISTIVMAFIVYLAVLQFNSNVVKLIIGIIVGVTSYMVCLYVLKDSLMIETLSIFRKKFRNRKIDN